VVTRWTPGEIAALEDAIRQGQMHPMEAKKKLAWEIVDIFHGSEAADAAAAHFARVHQQRELPQDIPEYALEEPRKLIEVMVASGMAGSKSQARRLIRQKGVKLDGQVIADTEMTLTPGEQILQVGKRRFLRLH
jgi:tyrosyl-tRNA synthetase